MQQYDTVKHADLTNETSDSTEKFGNKFILPWSSELCHKNNMLGLQNGPLKRRPHSFDIPKI